MILISLAGYCYGQYTYQKYQQYVKQWHQKSDHHCQVEVTNTPELKAGIIIGKIIQCDNTEKIKGSIRIFTKKTTENGEKLIVQIPKQEKTDHIEKNRPTQIGNYIISSTKLSSKNIQTVKKNPKKLTSWIRSLAIKKWQEKSTPYKNSMGKKVIDALIFGESQALGQQTWYSLQQTGTAHLIAISGLHMQIIGNRIYHLLCQIFSYYRLDKPKPFASLISILLVTLYGIISGFGVSCKRAWMSFIMSQGHQHRLISIDPIQRLLICACIHSLYFPHECIKTSFILSYGMVASIILLTTKRPNLHWVKQSMYISIASTPFNLYYWHNPLWIGALTNLFAIPWVTNVVLPCVIITFTFCLLEIPIEHLGLHLCTVSTQILLSTLRLFHR